MIAPINHYPGVFSEELMPKVRSFEIPTVINLSQTGGDTTGDFTPDDQMPGIPGSFSNPGADSKPVLADLDKDGRLEIIAATEEYGIFALRDNGALYWKNCMGGGNAEPNVADLNSDGWPDVVFGSDGGVVTAVNGQSGATRFTM